MSHFLLYANCIAVRGAAESIIMDLQQQNFIPIPNQLCDIFHLDLRCTSLSELYGLYPDEQEGIKQFFSHLAEVGYGFYTDEPHSFPPLHADFKSPFSIQSAILLYDENKNYDLKDALLQIEQEGCAIIQIRLGTPLSNDEISSLSEVFSTSRTKLVEIYISEKNADITFLNQLSQQNPRVRVMIHSAHKYEHQSDDFVRFTRNIISNDTKEVVSLESMISNVQFYRESKNFNVGLNQKVCIDANGHIKNHVHHSKSYGHISEVTVHQAINSKDFQSIWHVTKDQITVCKDCQFRYMCLDNAELLPKGEEFIRSEKCGFNPNTNTWSA